MKPSINLLHGDCLELMNDIPNKSIDMILCDLPYNITSNGWDLLIPFDSLWIQYKRIIKENGIVALFGSEPFTAMLICSNLEMYRHQWVWYKNRGSNFANTVREPMKEHETINIFSRGKWTYNPQLQMRSESGLSRTKYNVKFASNSENFRKFEPRESNTLQAMRVPSSVQKFNTETGLHPTQKPVALLEYLIRTYTNEGETILDNCMGSGSTGVACLNTNRNFIGIEKEEKYFQIAKDRIENHRVNKKLF